MSVEIECPSGLQLRIRGLKGKEGKLLADKNAIRQGTALDHMLSACTEEVMDPGPYSFTDNVDWNTVLLGDRFFALLQIRLATFGPKYTFRMQCRETGCRESFDWEVDLNDLEVQKLSEEDQDVIRAGGIFTTHLADGTGVKFRLATGADEKRAARNKTTEKALVDLLEMRITAIEGVGEYTADDIEKGRKVKSLRTYLDDLDWSDLIGLLNALDAHDCGVKTEIEVECPACRGVQEVQLPFDRGFFRPTETNGRSK